MISFSTPYRRFSLVRRAASAATLGLLWATAPVGAAAPTTAADYIAAFVRYVHWSDENQATAWTICVAGDPKNGPPDDYAAETVRGKPFAMRRVVGNADLVGCHVLDLTRAGATTISALLKRSRDKPVLSVGTGAGFCSAGGLICLREAGDEQKFEVNLSAVRASGLQISARLLKLGSDRTVTPGDTP